MLDVAQLTVYFVAANSVLYEVLNDVSVTADKPTIRPFRSYGQSTSPPAAVDAVSGFG